MRFVVVGCSYHRTPVELRERLAFTPAEIPGALTQLTSSPGVSEAMLVSTCNRVEIYCVGPEVEEVERACCTLLTESKGLSRDDVSPYAFRYSDAEALTHIFRVASSLDAMVVGEAQVMGQVKDAYALARQNESIGPMLGRCLDRAFSIAKRVRTETEIARHPASISSVAVDLAARIFEDLNAVNVLIVGAGEMAELAGRHLQSHGTSKLHVVNRSLENGRVLAETLGGHALPFDTLHEQLVWADVVITSTGSPEPIMSKKSLGNVLKERKQRTLLIVDIAVPRDVEQKARGLDNLYLFDVDALQQVVGQNLQARRKEAVVAEEMVVDEVEAFSSWMRSQSAVPLIKELRQHFSEMAQVEAQKTIRMLGLSGKDAKTLKKLANAIVGKLLHGPTTELKRSASSLEHARLTDAARHLFQLPSRRPNLQGDPES
ncbi:MAG: glutamyl-tRNA reductase [Deltaproteobacteria bacterium]|nr:glutamyl-tRNA reductase [Deltaproteobacteria bacterium]